MTEMDDRSPGNKDDKRPPMKPRRSSPSPRIRELANIYEPGARSSIGSRNASGRPSIDSSLRPAYQSDTSLQIPRSASHNRSLEAKPKTRVDGLPDTGGAFLPNFSHLREERKTIKESTSLSHLNDLTEDASISHDSCVTLAEEESLLTKVSRSHLGDYQPLTTGLSTSSTTLQPYPAHQIFANDAHPLYLPQLDDYLANDSIFVPPHFSDARTLCTEEEHELYGYGHEDGEKLASMEVCGAQLKVPMKLGRKGEALRRRKRSRREEDDLELAGLTKQVSPTIESFDEKDDKQKKLLLPSPTTQSKSAISTAEHPESRLEKFPPLMLLEKDSLLELKSNAIGPRKPPGGFRGYFTNVGSLLGIIVDFVIGSEGSSLAAGIFRLQLFIDFVQLTNLNSLFVKSSPSTQHPVNKFLLFTLPSFLALNFVSVFGFAVVIFFAFTLVVALLLLAFWRMTIKYNPNLNIEGYDSQPWLFRLFSRTRKTAASKNFHEIKGTPPWRSTPWTKFMNIIIVVLLTVLYIPLGKLSLDALVWSSDYWPSNANNQFATDPITWRDPADICYTTTMRKDEFNWAYIIMTVAAMAVILYTLWFPYQMRRTISTLLPRVPQYNELGHKRSKDDLNAGYIRLLQRDSSPLSFMYQAYKREWGNYKPLYLLFFKFSNIFVISVFVQDNCLWRKYDAKKIAVVQQCILIVMQTILLIVHIAVRPFIDQISNRSELVSRVGYVIDDLIGLFVVTQVKHAQKIDAGLLYTVYVFTYGGNIYFALANTSFFGHLFKRLQKRVDFSVDVFSPFLRLDMHIKRRVWQESLSTLLLTGSEYHMPFDQLVTFQILPNDCPPYLLSFQGTAAERHIENLKIVKQVGLDAYKRSVEELRGKEADRWKRVMKDIQLRHTGLDAYWKPFNQGTPAGVSSFFGKAFLMPFPPTLAIRHDQVPENQNQVVKLTTITELEMFVWQNSSEAIQRRKWVRMVLRSLDGQRVFCPHASTESQGKMGIFRRAGFSIDKPVFYFNGILKVSRNTPTMQEGYNFESGFRVSIVYDFGQRRGADGGEVIIRRKAEIDAAAAFGLRDDFEWTASVKQFFHANQDVANIRMRSIEMLSKEYRVFYYNEAREKRRTMNYSFLVDVFDQPSLDARQLDSQCQDSSCSEAVRRLPQRYPATTTSLLERLNVLHRSSIHRWWYLFWDDLWRMNARDYKAFRRQERVFSPQFPSSIAWTPLPRSQLEKLLKSKAGLWSETKKKTSIFTPGLLNQIYFTMEDLAFNQEGHAMQLGVKDKHGTIREATVSLLSPTQSSRLTGGGTDHDQSDILDRHEWAWAEQRLSAARGGGLWQAIRRFLTLHRYTPNDSIKEVWVYARLIDAGNGQWRYEAERRAPPYTGPPHPRTLVKRI
jgi:hypothetical protein